MRALQFEYTTPQTELEKLFGGFFCINAFGTIEGGDDSHFNDFLARASPPPRTPVYIDSAGGDVEAAINIGRIIRHSWFSTSIGTYVLRQETFSDPIVGRHLEAGQCMSAATLVFLGGTLRYFPSGAQFGVHRFSYHNPSPDDVERSQILSAKIASYVNEMGISPDFLEISSSVPSTDIKLITESELKSLRVITGGVTDVIWTLQARRGVLYVRGERDSLFGHQKVILCYNKTMGFLFWAVIEAQGREDELTGFKLVEIVLNGEENRIDISERCERVVSGIYVNILAKITEGEGAMIAYSDSFGVQVRFSAEAEMFLGVAAMTTEGGKEQLETFYNVLCRDN